MNISSASKSEREQAEAKIVYTIEFDEKSRVLTQRSGGFWDVEEVARYERELTAVLTRLKADGRPFTILQDSRGQPTQSAEVMRAFAEMSDAPIMQPVGRVAVLVTQMLNKLQAERVMPNPLIKVFRDEAEARQWLSGEDETNKRSALSSASSQS